MPRLRWSFDFGDWPSVDQLAWSCSLVRGALFQPRGLAAHWAEATRKHVLQSYGQWLHFLDRRGWLDPDVSPCARATEPRVVAYFDELNARIASTSVASSLRDLNEALRVMDPNGCRLHVQEIAKFAQQVAEPSRDERHKLVGASDFYYAGIGRMRLEQTDLVDPRVALAYGDGLMMAIEVCKAVRRKNLLAMEEGINLTREPSGNFRVRYGKVDSKSKKAEIEAVLPISLTPFIDVWLLRIRPALLSGRESRRMWLNTDGTDMKAHTLYNRFCRATEAELGVRINPHCVRKIVATAVTVSAPQLVEITQQLLDQNSDRMRRESYDLADKLAASAHHIDLLERRRRQALDRMDEK